MVYDQPDWNYKAADLTDATQAADRRAASVLNAVNPNLEQFRSRGGKLIVYHGWDDPAISALNTVNYYSEIMQRMGEQNVGSFLRLYLIPGMQHCGGGPGPSSFGQHGARAPHDPEHDIQLALEHWVEHGVAPTRIIASKYASHDSTRQVKMTRPLCPYPQVAKYNGSGDANHAENFRCAQSSK